LDFTCVVSDVLRFFADTQLSQNLKVIVCLILDSCSHQSCYCCWSLLSVFMF